MQLDADDEVASFSGGRKRRVLLARALVSEPELLLLDEPTNHLDIGAVDWLETQLGSFPGSIMLITHDRAFLDSVATLIMELDRGHLTEWPGNFSAYQKGKLAQLEVEAEQNSLFDKKLAQEEAWIRQGIKARRTRNEGRVRALEKLREQHRDRRSRSATANMSVNQAARSGKMVFEATDVSFQFDDQTVINNLDLVMLRNDRLGIIGPNGCGKSTLVRLLVGELEPTAGEIRRGTQLEVAYFDQLRTQLDPDRSAADNVSGGKDEVIINGASRHIMSYMQDFLFIPARARAPITALSGGETARLMLAKLFLQPSNLLVLDEPSNDLDIETLELLESLIAEYAGSVIMISHDRRLLDNIVTRSLVHQGAGRFIDVVGGYTDFERERLTSDHLKPVFPVDTRQNPSRTSTSELAVPQPTPTQPKINAGSGKASGSKAKLSQKFQRELDMQPALIDELEAQLEKLHTTMAEPDFYTNTATSSKVVEESEAKQLLLDAAYTRWEELEKMRNA